MKSERPRARALRLLREGITQGQFAAGQPLPPERDLAAAFKVSRNTLRWALLRLTDEGKVQSGGARTRLLAPAASAMAGAIHVYSSVDPARIHTRSHGWGSAVLEGAIHQLRGDGRTIVLPGHDARPDELLSFANTPPAGILLVDPAISGVAGAWGSAATALAKRVPTVVFGEEPEACDRVASDHEAGAAALTEWLLARGRRSPLCVWPEGIDAPWLLRRRAGYERAMRAAGLQPLPIERVRWDPNSTQPEAFQDQVLRLAGHLAPLLVGANPVDALMTISDGHVPACLAAARRCRREPGRDLDVVGYDAYWEEVPERAFHAESPAASVDKRNFELGVEMAKLLGERIAGTLPAAPQLRLITPQVTPIGD